MSEIVPVGTVGRAHITSKGYLRANVKIAVGKWKLRMVHDLVWEQHNGPIPEGFQVHHRDEDKQHNDIKNLELVDPLTHKRIHSGCELRNGEWWKPCRICKHGFPIKEFMRGRTHYPHPFCRKCYNRYMREQRSGS